jgi:hypothetical protein
MKKLLLTAVLGMTMVGGSLPILADTGTATTHATGPSVQPLSNEHNISFDAVPKAVKDIAREKVGWARIEHVDKGTLNGKTVYQLEYKKDKNHAVHLRITEDGKVLSEHSD